MKKLRRRILILMMTIVCITCTISALVTILSMNGFFGQRDIDVFVLGMAARDFILLILALVFTGLGVYMVSHSATNPVTELSDALKKVADGNYNVEVDILEKGEDISQLEENFNAMVKQLKYNEYLHKDFTSNISHEFKTPLAIIKGYSDLLKEDNLSEEERKTYADLISVEAERLTGLTSNLLRLSRLDNSGAYLKRSSFSLDEQIRQAVLNLEAKWTRKNIVIDIEMMEQTYYGDEDLLLQVWTNLIDNAIKFTDPGGKVMVTMEKDVDDLIILVEDNGIGMDDETIEHAFEQFYRGNTAKRYEGSGLGLSLVHRIVQLHGGTVSVESEQNSGACFMVVLPVKRN